MSAAQVRLNFPAREVGAATTTVEVTAAAESPLMTTSAVVGGIVTGDEILHLPLIDQNAANLALTQAQFAGGIGGGVSVAGGSTMTLATTVNGISVSNTRLDRAGGLLSFQLTQTVDMVEEVKVTSSPIDAENGRSLGSVSMIVRSGTNKFHGSLVDGLRNTDLDANTFWNNFSQPYLPRQTLIRNQFAARIGGPIRKNKTFFFVLYDGNRQRTSATATNTVLTAQARAGNYRYFPGAINSNYNQTNAVVNANGNAVMPSTATGPLQTVSVFGKDPNRPAADASGVVSKIVGETPLPNNFTIGDGLNTAGYTWPVPSYADLDQFTFKVDHYINQNNHLSVVVTHEHQYYTSTASVYPTSPVSGDNQDHSWFASGELRFHHLKADPAQPVQDWPPTSRSAAGQRRIGLSASLSEAKRASIHSRLYELHQPHSRQHRIRIDRPGLYLGRHGMTLDSRPPLSIRFGFQIDYTATNSYNINNNVTPAVTLGAGSTAVTGINTLPGLVSQNDALANEHTHRPRGLGFVDRTRIRRSQWQDPAMDRVPLARGLRATRCQRVHQGRLQSGHEPHRELRDAVGLGRRALGKMGPHA